MSDTTPDPKRRRLLRTAWKAGTGLLVVEAGWTTYEALKPLASAATGGDLVLSAPEAYAEKTATYVRKGRLYVTRVKGDLFALSQTCPHLGCQVPFCEPSGRFECPCHGSKYDLAGEWLEGPSPHGMDRYPLRVEDGKVVVDTRETIEGPPLGTRDYYTPPRGGSCAPGTA